MLVEHTEQVEVLIQVEAVEVVLQVLMMDLDLVELFTLVDQVL